MKANTQYVESSVMRPAKALWLSLAGPGCMELHGKARRQRR